MWIAAVFSAYTSLLSWSTLLHADRQTQVISLVDVRPPADHEAVKRTQQRKFLHIFLQIDGLSTALGARRAEALQPRQRPQEVSGMPHA